MTPRPARVTTIALLATILTSAVARAQRTESHLQEASANFDLEDVEPFLSRVAALLDSGFSAPQVKVLAAKIAKQPLDAEREYNYTVVAEGARTELRIVVFMDDVDAPDIAFLTAPRLARRIDAAMKKYFEEVGK